MTKIKKKAKKIKNDIEKYDKEVMKILDDLNLEVLEKLIKAIEVAGKYNFKRKL